MTNKTSLSYKDAGVDIDAGNALGDRIKGVLKNTRRPDSAHCAHCRKNIGNLFWSRVLTV